MDNHPRGRRDFLMTMTALGAAGFPVVATALRARPVHAALHEVSHQRRCHLDPRGELPPNLDDRVQLHTIRTRRG